MDNYSAAVRALEPDFDELGKTIEKNLGGNIRNAQQQLEDFRNQRAIEFDVRLSADIASRDIERQVSESLGDFAQRYRQQLLDVLVTADIPDKLGLPTTQELNQQETSLTNQLNTLEQVRRSLEIQDRITDDISRSLSFGISNAVLSAEKLSDVFRGIAKTIAGSLLQNLLIAPLTGGITNLIRGRQSGGPVSRGNPYIVGERGPELYVPDANGRIIPNGGFGAASFNFAPVFQTTDDQIREVATQQVAGLFPQFIESVEATLDKKRRYGNGT